MQERHSYKFQSFRAGEGVSAHVLPTRKFKTTTICLMIGRELDERSTHAALLAEVLRRGSAIYPDMRALATQLERMYGASFGCGVLRMGGRQILSMRLTVAGENFLPRRVALLDRAFEFLREILLRPLAVNGAFDADWVLREKHNLRAKITSLMNDRMAYAQRRCIEEMCRKERFRFYEHGDVKAVGRITPRGLYEFHKEMLSTRPVHVFVVGDVAVRRVVNRVRGMFAWRGAGEYSFDGMESQPSPRRARKVVERQDVEQAKLCIGLRTYTGAREADYPAAVVYNGLLGAFSHSRLFRSIREKAGLAYDAHSFIEGSKGLVLIGIGLKGSDFDEAMRIIRRQMSDLREGRISRDDMAKTRKSLTTRLRSSLDSPLQFINLHYSQMINGVVLTLEQWTRKIRAVRPADVEALARKVIVDTIYLLIPDGKK